MPARAPASPPPCPRGAALGVFSPSRRLPRARGGAGVGVPRVGVSPAGSAPRAAVFRAAPRLGRRLAADLELVRTRGIRLFN